MPVVNKINLLSFFQPSSAFEKDRTSSSRSSRRSSSRSRRREAGGTNWNHDTLRQFLHCVNNLLVVPARVNISAVGTEEIIRPSSFLSCMAFYSVRKGQPWKKKLRHWRVLNPPSIIPPRQTCSKISTSTERRSPTLQKGGIIEQRKSCGTCRAACRPTTPVYYFSF